MDRRNFIQSGALLSGGLLLGFKVPMANKLANLAADSTFAPNAYLNIAPNNTITIILSHVEMGQGIWTTLPMLIADELDADLKQVTVKHSGVDKAYNHTAYGIQITGGSSSTWSEFDRYRNAGATARVLLIKAAAQRSGVNELNCKTENGYVIAGGKKYSYGELAADAAKLPIPAGVPLRTPSEWKYVTKGSKRLDTKVKTDGTAKFGMDMQFPGLLTAVVAHAPVIGGKVRSFDAAKAKLVPGVKQIVQIPQGIAVLADNFWSANEARKVLTVVWDHRSGANLSTATQKAAYKKLAASNGLPAAKKGDANAALTKAQKTITAEYVFPYLAHAPMEPLNCTVKISGDKAEIWTGTQLPGVDQAAAAKILDIKPENVTMNIPYLGGGFGRRATMSSDFVSEAVQIAKVSGKAIKMVWTREDDMKAGYYRPFYIHNIQVGLGPDGLPMAWKHNIAGQSIMAGTPMAAGIKNGIDDSSVEGVNNSPYLDQIADHFVGLHTTQEVMPVLWYRSVGNTHTAYAMETMIDEMAHAAGQDPVDYRRKLLKGNEKAKRHLTALNLVAEKGNWKAKPGAGRFKGVAVHEAFGSFVGIIAEISVDYGQVRVHKVDCAIDCGLVVNPDGLIAQMESGIIFGITMAMYGEITLENGKVQQNNFYDYRIARINETPEINVWIANSQEKMGGAGEVAVPPTAPAIANAIFAATGKRIYDLPIVNHNFKILT